MPAKSSTLCTAIYARAGTHHQDADIQLRELRQYAQMRGFNVVGEFVDYESGSKEDRAQLNRMMDLARKRSIDCVLVWKFDRFARSSTHLIIALEEFGNLGIHFISQTENIDTPSPLGQAMHTIIAAVAQFERELIRERVRAGIQKARAQGKPHGRPATKAGTVKEMRRLRQQGWSLRKVTRQLGVSPQTVKNHAG